jgi:hypothetical protein
MKVKKLNAKNAEVPIAIGTQRTAEFDISGFLCGTLCKTLRFFAVKIQLIILTKRHWLVYSYTLLSFRHGSKSKIFLYKNHEH